MSPCLSHVWVCHLVQTHIFFFLVHSDVAAHACGGQRATSGAPRHLFLLKTGSFTGLGLTHLSRGQASLGLCRIPEVERSLLARQAVSRPPGWGLSRRTVFNLSGFLSGAP